MKWKKYVKNVLVFILTVFGIIAGVFLGIRFFRFFMPFVIGWLIALIANPLVRMLERRLKVARKHTSMLLIIAVLAVIVGGIYLIGAKTVEETKSLIEQAPQIYVDIRKDVDTAGENLSMIVKELPENIQTAIDDFEDNIGDSIANLIGKLSQVTVDQAGNLAKNLPSIFVSIIFTILSAYFFIAEREEILAFGRESIPSIIQEKWRFLSNSFKAVFGGYFKAQFKIMGVICAILFVGFLFLRVKFAILVAILIAFLDMLPFFGTGTALIPWALFKLISGDLQYAVFLVILYLTTQLVRRIIEPKLVGDSIGISPLLTLIFMYTGYKLGGVLGMILAVPVGAIVINLFQVGVFDGMIKGAKNVINDILKWMYHDTGDKAENKRE